MAFLKRFEIWLLLAVVMAGLVWVFTSQPADETDDWTGGAAPQAPDAALVFRRGVIERDYGNVRLDLDVRVRNDKAEKLVMAPPAVRLMTASGREVPSFFLPFEKLPEVAANSTQEVQLRYWLEKPDLEGSLTLHVENHSMAVKGTAPMDIESLKNREPKTISATEW